MPTSNSLPLLLLLAKIDNKGEEKNLGEEDEKEWQTFREQFKVRIFDFPEVIIT